MRKKRVAIWLLLLCSLFLCACGAGVDSGSSATSGTQKEESTGSTDSSSEQDSGSSSTQDSESSSIDDENMWGPWVD